jgi:hypothetical protein
MNYRKLIFDKTIDELVAEMRKTKIGQAKCAEGSPAIAIKDFRQCVNDPDFPQTVAMHW